MYVDDMTVIILHTVVHIDKEGVIKLLRLY